MQQGKTTQKVNSFTDLETWQEGHRLVVGVFKLSQTFPLRGGRSLADQMQRAAMSITSNIAEGFGRQAINDKAHFYVIARGSATELQNQLLIARDVSFCSNETFQKLAAQTITVHKLINGLIKSIKARKV